MNKISFLITTLFLSLLLGCSSPSKENVDPNFPTQPSPTPPQKKEIVHRCSISNGAGRMFYATATTQYVAESKARRECSTSYRNCISLGCKEIAEEE